jgi:hypothetical protein
MPLLTPFIRSTAFALELRCLLTATDGGVNEVDEGVL